MAEPVGRQHSIDGVPSYMLARARALGNVTPLEIDDFILANAGRYLIFSLALIICTMHFFFLPCHLLHASSRDLADVLLFKQCIFTDTDQDDGWWETGTSVLTGRATHIFESAWGKWFLVCIPRTRLLAYCLYTDCPPF